MRQLAQFPEATGSGVPLQGMHRATDGAHRLLIAGIFLELQRFLVERLQYFLRALEEQFPQFRAAFVGELGHSASSMR